MSEFDAAVGTSTTWTPTPSDNRVQDADEEEESSGTTGTGSSDDSGSSSNDDKTADDKSPESESGIDFSRLKEITEGLDPKKMAEESETTPVPPDDSSDPASPRTAEPAGPIDWSTLREATESLSGTPPASQPSSGSVVGHTDPPDMGANPCAASAGTVSQADYEAAIDSFLDSKKAELIALYEAAYGADNALGGFSIDLSLKVMTNGNIVVAGRIKGGDIESLPGHPFNKGKAKAFLNEVVVNTILNDWQLTGITAPTDPVAYETTLPVEFTPPAVAGDPVVAGPTINDPELAAVFGPLQSWPTLTDRTPLDTLEAELEALEQSVTQASNTPIADTSSLPLVAGALERFGNEGDLGKLWAQLLEQERRLANLRTTVTADNLASDDDSGGKRKRAGLRDGRLAQFQTALDLLENKRAELVDQIDGEMRALVARRSELVAEIPLPSTTDPLVIEEGMTEVIVPLGFDPLAVHKVALTYDTGSASAAMKELEFTIVGDSLKVILPDPLPDERPLTLAVALYGSPILDFELQFAPSTTQPNETDRQRIVSEPGEPLRVAVAISASDKQVPVTLWGPDPSTDPTVKDSRKRTVRGVLYETVFQTLTFPISRHRDQAKPYTFTATINGEPVVVDVYVGKDLDAAKAKVIAADQDAAREVLEQKLKDAKAALTPLQKRIDSIKADKLQEGDIDGALEELGKIEEELKVLQKIATEVEQAAADTERYGNTSGTIDRAKTLRDVEIKAVLKKVTDKRQAVTERRAEILGDASDAAKADDQRRAREALDTTLGLRIGDKDRLGEQLDDVSTTDADLPNERAIGIARGELDRIRRELGELRAQVQAEINDNIVNEADYGDATATRGLRDGAAELDGEIVALLEEVKTKEEALTAREEVLRREAAAVASAEEQEKVQGKSRGKLQAELDAYEKAVDQEHDRIAAVGTSDSDLPNDGAIAVAREKLSKARVALDELRPKVSDIATKAADEATYGKPSKTQSLREESVALDGEIGKLLKEIDKKEKEVTAREEVLRREAAAAAGAADLSAQQEKARAALARTVQQGNASKNRLQSDLSAVNTSEASLPDDQAIGAARVELSRIRGELERARKTVTEDVLGNLSDTKTYGDAAATRSLRENAEQLKGDIEGLLKTVGEKELAVTKREEALQRASQAAAEAAADLTRTQASARDALAKQLDSYKRTMVELRTRLGKVKTGDSDLPDSTAVAAAKKELGEIKQGLESLRGKIQPNILGKLSNTKEYGEASLTESIRDGATQLDDDIGQLLGDLDQKERVVVAREKVVIAQEAAAKKTAEQDAARKKDIEIPLGEKKAAVDTADRAVKGIKPNELDGRGIAEANRTLDTQDGDLKRLQREVRALKSKAADTKTYGQTNALIAQAASLDARLTTLLGEVTTKREELRARSDELRRQAAQSKATDQEQARQALLEQAKGLAETDVQVALDGVDLTLDPTSVGDADQARGLADKFEEAARELRRIADRLKDLQKKLDESDDRDERFGDHSARETVRSYLRDKLREIEQQQQQAAIRFEPLRDQARTLDAQAEAGTATSVESSATKGQAADMDEYRRLVKEQMAAELLGPYFETFRSFVSKNPQLIVGLTTSLELNDDGTIKGATVSISNITGNKNKREAQDLAKAMDEALQAWIKTNPTFVKLPAGKNPEAVILELGLSRKKLEDYDDGPSDRGTREPQPATGRPAPKPAPTRAPGGSDTTASRGSNGYRSASAAQAERPSARPVDPAIGRIRMKFKAGLEITPEERRKLTGFLRQEQAAGRDLSPKEKALLGGASGGLADAELNLGEGPDLTNIDLSGGNGNGNGNDNGSSVFRGPRGSGDLTGGTAEQTDITGVDVSGLSVGSNGEEEEDDVLPTNVNEYEAYLDTKKIPALQRQGRTAIAEFHDRFPNLAFSGDVKMTIEPDGYTLIEQGELREPDSGLRRGELYDRNAADAAFSAFVNDLSIRIEMPPIPGATEAITRTFSVESHPSAGAKLVMSRRAKRLDMSRSVDISGLNDALADLESSLRAHSDDLGVYLGATAIVEFQVNFSGNSRKGRLSSTPDTQMQFLIFKGGGVQPTSAAVLKVDDLKGRWQGPLLSQLEFSRDSGSGDQTLVVQLQITIQPEGWDRY